VIDLPEGWVADEQAGRWTVEGACPTCHGPAFGPPLSIAAEEHASRVSEVLRAPDGAGVYAACHCEHDHGHDGATSCGREWVVKL
jgi:hypothetical protein